MTLVRFWSTVLIPALVVIFVFWKSALDLLRNRRSSGPRVRLLDFQPSTIGCIQCKTVEVPIQELATRKYAALSYRWDQGETRDSSCQIKVDGQTFHVHKNVYDFLHEMVSTMPRVHNNRYSFLRENLLTTPRKLFFIDAISINQNDIGEKNRQVGLMGQIYAHAETVVIWLGQQDPDGVTDLCLFHLSRRLNVRNPNRYNPKEWLECERRGLEYICKHPYWTRLWIVQEIMLAKSIVIWAASHKFEWDMIQDIKGPRFLPPTLFFDPFDQVWGRGDLNPPFTNARKMQEETGLIWGNALQIIDMKQKWDRRCQMTGFAAISTPQTLPSPSTNRIGIPIHHAICLLPDQECKLVKDKIFAVLGLADDHHNIEVDYNKSDLEIFQMAISCGFDAICRQMTSHKTRIPTQIFYRYAYQLVESYPLSPAMLPQVERLVKQAVIERVGGHGVATIERALEPFQKTQTRSERRRYNKKLKSSPLPTRLPPAVNELPKWDSSLKSYIRIPSSDERGKGFCSRCATIDFEAIWTLLTSDFGFIHPTDSSPQPGKAEEAFWPPGIPRFPHFTYSRSDLSLVAVPVFDLGSRLVTGIDHCPLCDLFSVVSELGGRSKTVPRWCLAVETPLIPPFGRKRLFLIGKSTYWGSDALQRGEILLLPASKSLKVAKANPRPSGASALAMHAPYDLFASEIETCQQDHSGHLSTQPADHVTIPGFKLIDCKAMCVVDAPDKTDYVALSYIWGPAPSSPPFVTSSGKLIRKKLAPTIADSMAATKNLGKRYLWVDRYCINQTDKHARLQQVSTMHLVFKQSWVTIVSLGVDDQAVLPGVRSIRSQRLLVQASHFEVTNAGPDLQTCHAYSNWPSRAWTFQEAFFSPRLLFFTPTQAFLTCERGTFSEATADSFHCRPWRGRDDGSSNPEEGLRKETLTGTKSLIPGRLNFGNALQNYCSRNLSSELDSINAFRGFLSACGMMCCRGIPYPHIIDDDPELPLQRRPYSLGACIGLSWWQEANSGSTLVVQASDDEKNGRLCEAMPSWSWASCRRGLKVFSAEESLEPNMKQIFQKLIFSPNRIDSEATDGKLVPWDEHLDEISSNLSNYLHIETRLTTFTIPVQQAAVGAPKPFLPFDSFKPNPVVPLSATLDWPVMEWIGVENFTLTFLPDVRVPCTCHSGLDLQVQAPTPTQPPMSIRTAITGFAALLFVQSGSYSSVTAWWLALRSDGARGAMRRVGIIQLKFDMPKSAQIIHPHNPLRDRLDISPVKNALNRDMQQAGAVARVRIR